MSGRSYTQDTLKFLMIALALMIGVHFLMPSQEEAVAPEQPAEVDHFTVLDEMAERVQEEQEEEVWDITENFEAEPDEEKVVEAPQDVFESEQVVLESRIPEGFEDGVLMSRAPEDELDEDGVVETVAEVGPHHHVVEEFPEEGVEVTVTEKSRHSGKPKIVIVIDDMGMSEERTKQVIALPGPITAAFLPYADGVREQAKWAAEAGHELIIHTPMEPMNGDLDMGSIALRTGMTRHEFERVLKDEVLTAFDGYKGINNHMGSRLTQDEGAMRLLMKTLKERGLFFVDSKTIHSSIAARVAHLYEVEYAERDVFLDHYDTIESVYAALAQLERAARRNSYAIAIGHPKAHTLEALEKWLPTLEEKGFELVPVSAVLESPWDDVQDNDNAEKLVSVPETAAGDPAP